MTNCHSKFACHHLCEHVRIREHWIPVSCQLSLKPVIFWERQVVQFLRYKAPFEVACYGDVESLQIDSSKLTIHT